MARKINVQKPSQEIRGQAEVTNRRPVPQVTPYLLQAQIQKPKIFPPKRRVQLSIEVEMRLEAPDPVKIIHAG